MTPPGIEPGPPSSLVRCPTDELSHQVMLLSDGVDSIPTEFEPCLLKSHHFCHTKKCLDSGFAREDIISHMKLRISFRSVSRACPPFHNMPYCEFGAK